MIDTKWKLIRDGRLSDADLKQMLVYNLYWKTDRSILLNPGAESGVAIGDDSTKANQDLRSRIRMFSTTAK